MRAIVLTFYDEEEFRRFLRRPGAFSLRELDIARREVSPLMVAIRRVLAASRTPMHVLDLIERSLALAGRMGHRSNARTARRYIKRLVDDGDIRHVRTSYYERDA